MKARVLIPQKAPLDDHPAFRASRYDALEEAVATQLAAKFVELPSRPAALDARANRFNLPNGSLWFCSYGTPVAIQFPEPDHIRVQFHHAGVGATWIGDTLAPVNANQACVTSTAAEFDFGADFQQVVWRISKDAVRKKLASLTEAPLSGDVVFNHKLDLRNPQAQLLAQLMGCTIRAAESVSGEPGRIVLGELEQALTSTFLAASEHRYRDHLEGRVPAAAPWQVRRAEGYIAANWDKPLEIETLAEVTGASVRSIFRAFKQSRGYTPFEFAKRIRLSHARRMLEEAEAGGSVTSVCFACGFSDLGRFSKDFVQAFGERPSDVLKRHKGALAALH
jgi:AraC-like DNA-binding protein